MTTRRDFIKYTSLAGAGVYVQTKYGWVRQALAATQGPGLGDPAM